MQGQPDFGYPWWLSYGHLCVAVFLLLVLIVGWRRRWPKVVVAVLLCGVLWAGTSFVAARFVMHLNGRASLPTQNFLRSGAGRVLDMGAGTGRSSIMVLEARPQTRLVALDLFGRSWEQHFGPRPSPQDLLQSNLRAAGVADRATVQAGDMRQLPFQSDEFDGIVSSYAIDHLNRDGIRQALSEAARVLKPGGEFLLMVIGKDPWLQFTFGPLLLHSGTRGAEWWSGSLQQAGFDVLESGMRPATLYLVARKR
jgi:ubiquinone/menaquinone biosynthesis C-methylase UbiE